nr:hypothetical protein [Eubacterium sp.]
FFEGLNWFSPVIKMSSSFSCSCSWETAKLNVYGIYYPLIYAIVGIVFLVIAFVMYEKRKSENAGSAIAFSFAKPIFKYCVALYAGLGIGELITVLVVEVYGTGYVYNNKNSAIIYPMAVIFSILGFYAAEMIMNKTTRVFKGSLKKVVPVGALMVLLIACFNMDVFGYEEYIPSADNVSYVSVGLNSLSEGNFESDNEGVIEQVSELHSYIIENKAASENNYAVYESDMLTGTEYSEYVETTIDIVYTLNNGRVVKRNYSVCYSVADLGTSEGFGGMLTALLKNEDVAEAAFDTACRFESISYAQLYSSIDDGGFDYSVINVDDNSDYQKIYEALREDYKKHMFEIVLMDQLMTGYNLGYNDFFEENTLYANGLQLEYNSYYGDGEEEYTSAVYDIQLASYLENTMKVLEDMGAFEKTSLKVVTDKDYYNIDYMY